MEPDRAFAVLDLTRSATEAEIDSAYREKARGAHPDAEGGSDAAMKELNEARDVALAIARERSLVVIASAITAPLTAQMARTEVREQANQLVHGVTEIHVGRVKAVRRWALLLTAGSGAYAVLFTNLLSYVSTQIRDPTLAPSPGLEGTVALALTVAFGAISALLTTTATALEQRIEDFANGLKSRGTFAGVMREIGVRPGDRLRPRDLDRRILDWAGYRSPVLGSILPVPRARMSARRMAATLGPEDTARLMIEMGTLNGMLREVDVVDGDDYDIAYEFSPTRRV